MFETTFHHCAVGLAHVSPSGEFIRVNKTLSDFLGYDIEAFSTLSIQEITAPSHLATDLNLLNKTLCGEIDTYSLEKKYLHKEGHEVWGKLTVSLVRDKQGKPDYFISVVEDIDNMKKVESELFQAEALFSEIVSAFSSRTYIWVASADLTKLHYANEGFQNIFGRDVSVLANDPLKFLNYVHPEDRTRVAQVFANKPLAPWDVQYRIYDPDGKVKYIHDRGIPLYDEEDKLSMIAGTADDITQQKEQEAALVDAVAKLEALSKTDSLTGLANRREMFQHLDQSIVQMKRSELVSTLVFIDLNNFKVINDTYGHKAGDLALTSFAQYMQGHLRETDKLARLGGDEFVLLLYGTNGNDTTQFFNRLLAAPINVECEVGNTIPLSFSVGISEWNPDINDPQQWIDAADASMYEQKRQHHSNAGVDKEVG
ncbi:diguanylate cyclase [Alteromonas australica]|uniref:Diguanylate cyclase n=1 Tax=Alteromonas australica TaxID=589873 RepID=A0A075NVC6_9ALTE|nr:diguanylate cyclase [Alteromonas australica]AIF98604.1 diguanylate cyclase [Alteromonas australica]